MRKSRLIFVLAFVIALISALYACNPDGLTIKFDSKGGSEVSSIQLEAKATEFTFPQAPEKTGYDFDNWYLDSELTKEANVTNVLATFEDKVAEVTLYAKWTPVTYTISFDSGTGGSAAADISVAYGATTFTMPAVPTKTGSDFSGWYLESGYITAATVENVLAALTTGTRTITLYAKWTPISYAILFNSGEGGSAVADIAVAFGATTFTMPTAPTKTGNYFSGWYLESGYITAATVENVLAALSPTSNTITLYAKWTPVVYIISFNSGDGGSAVADIAVAFGATTFTMPATAPTKTGNDFSGWYLESGYTTAATVENVLTALSPTANTITLYAKWTPVTYTVSFDSGEGGNAVADLSIAYGSTAFTMPETAPTKTGNDFSGWYLESGYTTAATVENVLAALTTETRTIMLYAKWAPIVYTISFNSGDGGSAVADLSVAYGSTTFTMPTDPTKADNDFVDWYLESGYTTVATIENVLAALTTETRTITLYAKWTPAYFISYATDGGSAVEPSIFLVGTQTFVFPAEPTKTGCIFMGWYLEDTFDTEATEGNVLAGLTEENNTRTLYARWRDEITYKVKFNTNGGTMVADARFSETNMTFEFPSQEGLERADHFFEGWFLDLDTWQVPATEENVLELLDSQTTEVTVYLKWMIPYYIIFSGNYDEYIPTLAIRTDATTFEIPECNARYDSFFDGWYFYYHGDEFEGSVENILDSLNVNERSVYLIARITPAWFVSFNTNFGTEIPQLKLRNGAEGFDFPDDPTRPDSTFQGWYLDDMVTVATVSSVISLFSGENFEVTVYAKWEESEDGQAYSVAKADLFEAMLYAFEETRGKGVNEGLTEQENIELEQLKVFFDFQNYNDDPLYYAYEDFSKKLFIQSFYSQYTRFMQLFRQESLTTEEQQEMEEILKNISKLKDIYIDWDTPNYYQRLMQLRQNQSLFGVCEEYWELYNIQEPTTQDLDRMTELEGIIGSSSVYDEDYYYWGYAQFAEFFITDESSVFTAQEEQDAQRYVALLRKAFEYNYYIKAENSFGFTMERTLGYLFRTDITIDKIISLTEALNDFDYAAMFVGKNEDGGTYYYPNPQEMIDGFLYIIGDEAAGWSSDDLGIVLHKYIWASYSFGIEQSPEMAQELIAQRDSITEEVALDFAEVVIGLMNIVKSNDIFGNFNAGVTSIQEIAVALSSVSAALIDFTNAYDAERIDNLIYTILPLTPIMYMMPEEFYPQLFEMKYHALLSKVGEVLALADQTMLNSIFTFNGESLVLNNTLAFLNENLAIFEAKVLCVLYGEDYNAAEFAANYDSTEVEMFSNIITAVMERFNKNNKRAYDAPMNKGYSFFEIMIETGIIPFVGGNILKDMIKEQICISEARYNAIKAIAQKSYDVRLASENPETPPVTPEEMENLIIINSFIRAQSIFPEIEGIYTILNILYVGQNQEEAEDVKGEISLLTLLLAINGVEIEKIRNFKYMLEDGIANEIDLDLSGRVNAYQALYLVYALLTAYNDGTETVYTPFTVEEISRLCAYVFGYAAEYDEISYLLAYLIGYSGDPELSEAENAELMAALQELTANDDAYLDDLTFMAIKFIELFAHGVFDETVSVAPPIYALEGLKAYYADNEITVSVDALVSAFRLIKTIGSIYGDMWKTPEYEVESIVEFLAIIELVIGNEKYNSFDEFIDLLIALVEESEALAEAERLDEYQDDNSDYYFSHNFIKTLYIIFGENPETDFADVAALAGDDTPCSILLQIIFADYETIKAWAILDYDYETAESFYSDLGYTLNDIFYMLSQIFPFLVK